MDNEKIILEDNDKKFFLNGVKIKVKHLDGIYRIYNNNNFIGTGIVCNNILKRDIIVC